MKHLLTFVLAAFISLPAFAADSAEPVELPLIRPAESSDLSEFLWINRPVIVFADSPNDPKFLEQIELFSSEAAELQTRDVIVLIDTDPAAKSPVRIKLRPRGFTMVLVGKDGGVKLRKPRPWTVRELTRVIDKTPSRQREVRERRVSP